jgi:2,5-furandicarboxylate decarboxylase 1
MIANEPDFERFRLRGLIDRLVALDAVEIHEEPVALADLSGIIEASEKAVLFRRAGPQQTELVAGVMGSRARLAAAMEVTEAEMVREYARRMATPQSSFEVASELAPVHQVVLTGGEIDLTHLPFHLQHDSDGGPYISSAIDYSVDPATGRRNVGCRRLMLRSRTTMRSNLSQPSDLQRIYKGCVARGERLPVSFAIGSHPMDYLAATLRLPGDEYDLVATLRGAKLPMVRGVTNDLLAPADAEMIIEGYFDEQGYRELEGPYGEFWGYYGPVHIDPVFHVTAITMRRDALHQSVLHGGRNLARMDMAAIAALNTEAAVFRALRAVNIEPAAVHAVTTAAPRQHLRVALANPAKGQARAAISALFAIVGMKQVVIVDDDIDVRSDAEVEWAISCRFRADRDLVVANGFLAYYADPTADGQTVAKMGLDATQKVPDTLESRRPLPPHVVRARGYDSVRELLAVGPKSFRALMEGLGSDDGREIVLELDRLRAAGQLGRTDDGEWRLINEQG